MTANIQISSHIRTTWQIAGKKINVGFDIIVTQWIRTLWKDKPNVSLCFRHYINTLRTLALPTRLVDWFRGREATGTSKSSSVTRERNLRTCTSRDYLRLRWILGYGIRSPL